MLDQSLIGILGVSRVTVGRLIVATGYSFTSHFKGLIMVVAFYGQIVLTVVHHFVSMFYGQIVL